MAATIKWADIEAATGHYRDGFVKVYLKYKGMDTDEVDASNRVVKVTEASFARHFDILERTFRYWVKAYVQTGTAKPSKVSATISGTSTATVNGNSKGKGPQTAASSKAPAQATAKVVPVLIPSAEVNLQNLNEGLNKIGAALGVIVMILNEDLTTAEVVGDESAMVSMRWISDLVHNSIDPILQGVSVA
jgi:hypothetical protein